MKELQTKYCLQVMTDKKVEISWSHPSEGGMLRAANKQVVLNKIMVKYSKLISSNNNSSTPCVDAISIDKNSNDAAKAKISYRGEPNNDTSVLNFAKDGAIGPGSTSSVKNESLVGSKEIFPEKITKKEVSNGVNVNPSTTNSNRKPSSFINKNAPVFTPQFIAGGQGQESGNPCGVYTTIVNNNLNNLGVGSIPGGGR